MIKIVLSGRFRICSLTLFFISVVNESGDKYCITSDFEYYIKVNADCENILRDHIPVEFLYL